MLILGSGSSARRSLLISIGLIPDKILIPNIDEHSKKNELPVDYVLRMAIEKSEVLVVNSNDFLITADTIVVEGKNILHKVEDRQKAKGYLRQLSGTTHKVYTAFNIKHKKKNYCGIEKTLLKMKYLTDFEIDCYLDKNEWQGKAGGYGIQGLAGKFFPVVKGCFPNVIGLPLSRLDNVLKGIGFYRVDADE